MSTAQKVIDALASYKIKSTGKNEYRSCSPFRADSDSPSFALKIQDDEHGSYYDHVAEEVEQPVGPVLALGQVEQLGLLVNEARVGGGREELWVLDDVEDEGDVGLDAADAELAEGAVHLAVGVVQGAGLGSDLQG